ncbi:MAG: hypothetical protein GY710_15950 [Desulfobacteraceae bacterium]|nr:hypothetical protein [Desulfobacteraceae bacterium]
MKNSLLLFLIMPLLFSCAHHKDVMPGPNGINNISISTDNPDEAKRSTIDQANCFCKEYGGGYAIVLDEKVSYAGDMDEQNYKNAKKITQIAQSLGSKIWMNDTKKGGTIMDGASIGDEVLGKGYKVNMKFKCSNQ